MFDANPLDRRGELMCDIAFRSALRGIRIFPYLFNLQGAELNDQMQQMIKNQLIIILNILEGVQYVLMAGGTLAFLLFTVWYIIRKRQENKVQPFN